MALTRALRKRLVFTLLTLGVAHAADGTPVREAELADKLRFYASIASLEADFHQVKDLKDMGMRMKSEGRFRLEPPSGAVVWEVRKPAHVKVELDAKGIRITSGDGAQATIQTFRAEEMPKGGDAASLHDLVAWLKLDAHALAEQYEIARLPDDRFLFTPRKPGPFRTMEMALAKDGHLKTLVLDEASGDRMTIAFEKPRVVRKAAAKKARP